MAGFLGDDPAEALEVMARTIFGESRGEPIEGQYAVGWVIRNRASKPRWWGQDIKSVCLKPWQFSCWNDEDPSRDRLTSVTLADARYMQCLGVAAHVLSGAVADPTAGACWYHTIARPRIAEHWPPKWTLALRETVRIGAHVFYGEPS